MPVRGNPGWPNSLIPIGEIVQDEWFASADIRKEIRLDPEDFVVMPNHIHGVVQIVEDVGAHGMRPAIHSGGQPALHTPVVGATGQSPLLKYQRPRGPAPKSLSSFIVGFKTSVTKRALAFDETLAGSIWQRNYYEHIIRNEREWARIRAYIETSPANWAHVDENPHR